MSKFEVANINQAKRHKPEFIPTIDLAIRHGSQDEEELYSTIKYQLTQLKNLMKDGIPILNYTKRSLLPDQEIDVLNKVNNNMITTIESCSDVISRLIASPGLKNVFDKESKRNKYNLVSVLKTQMSILATISLICDKALTKGELKNVIAEVDALLTILQSWIEAEEVLIEDWVTNIPEKTMKFRFLRPRKGF